MATASSVEPRSMRSPSSLYESVTFCAALKPVQRVLPALHLHVGVAGGEQCHDADDDERDSGDP